MADPRDALIAELQRVNEQLGALVAQQQSVMAAQRQLIADLERRLSEQDAAYAARATKLESEVRRLERELLGPKSEKIKIPPAERDLGEPEPNEEELIRRREEVAKKRRQRALQKQAMLTRDIPHSVPDAEKQCPKCHGTKFGTLGFETSTVYEYVPGHFERRIHRREKAACACGQYIVTAPGPAKLVPGGQYGFGFAAFLIVEKCADSIPIYRIERRFERLGIPMSRATMNDILHAAAELATPLLERLRARIAALPIVLADETSMRMQQPRKRGFVWVFHGHDDASDGELVLYVFAADRSGQTPAQLLGGTRGILVVDGYTGYNNVTDPDGRARAGCWCHLRRKLYEARTTEGDDADIGIGKLRPLFRVEHEATAIEIVGTPEHLELRTQRSKPVVDDFFQWATTLHASVLPKSPLGEALGYAIRQRPRLELFLSDARIPIHNNGSERRLRVVALGRKNYLFVGHARAGRNIAGLYSLVGSCIANGVEPTEYLIDVLPRIAGANSDEALDALLPDRWRPTGPAP